MRISTKGRYGLAVMLCIAEKKDESQTVALISKKQKPLSNDIIFFPSFAREGK